MKKLAVNKQQFKELCLKHTYPEVADMLGISKSSVYNIASKMNIRKSPGRPKDSGIVFKEY